MNYEFSSSNAGGGIVKMANRRDIPGSIVRPPRASSSVNIVHYILLLYIMHAHNIAQLDIGLGRRMEIPILQSVALLLPAVRVSPYYIILLYIFFFFLI